ncbi:hypothetical protein N0V85_008338 [Neurospora sp. IMI 360204]|nr:hypothetical protein N0V85_008338 [Neurospora sp. IMI 360204]
MTSQSDSRSEVGPLASETSVDNSNSSDLDLPNILYIQNIPIVSAEKNAELNARIKSINSWLAWELTRVEELVQTKIKSSELPADGSVDSKSRRTAYRHKVVSNHRGGSLWITKSSTQNSVSETVVAEDNINQTVARIILRTLGTDISDSPQVLTVAKAVGASFSGLAQTVQPHVLHLIDYYHDTVRDTIAASIKSFYFKVSLTETVAPAPPPVKGSGILGGIVGGHDKAPAAPPKGKFYKVSVEHTTTSSGFDFDLWDKHDPKDEVRYALGKKLLAYKQLRLLKEL